MFKNWVKSLGKNDPLGIPEKENVDLCGTQGKVTKINPLTDTSIGQPELIIK